jgi:hypothetical protein
VGDRVTGPVLHAYRVRPCVGQISGRTQAALEKALGNFPPVSTITAFVLNPLEIRAIIRARAPFVPDSSGLVGIYAIQISTHRRVGMVLSGSSGRAAMAVLSDVMPTQASRTAVRDFASQIYSRP